MRYNENPKPTLILDAPAKEQVFTMDEQCVAMTGMDIDTLVLAIFNNKYGQYNHLFMKNEQDKPSGKKRRTKKICL